MVELRAARYLRSMQANTIASASLPEVRSSSVAPRGWPAALVLAVFVPFSFWVIAKDGVMGLPRVVSEEPWAAQMLFDLGSSCFVAGTWMVRDARQRKLTVWPFVVATALLGSIGLLAYYVRRSFSDAPAR